MMFEILRMDMVETDGKIHWLEAVGVEIYRVLSFIDRVLNERISHLKLQMITFALVHVVQEYSLNY